MHCGADTDLQVLQLDSLQVCALFWSGIGAFRSSFMHMPTLSADKPNLGISWRGLVASK